MVIFDDKLFVFGGGTSDECHALSIVFALDLQTRVWKELQTHGDPKVSCEDGIHSNQFPAPRKCHSVVKHGKCSASSESS